MNWAYIMKTKLSLVWFGGTVVENGKEKRIMGREAGKVEGRQTTNGATASEGKSLEQHFRDCSKAVSLQLLWRSGLVMQMCF